VGGGRRLSILFPGCIAKLLESSSNVESPPTIAHETDFKEARFTVVDRHPIILVVTILTLVTPVAIFLFFTACSTTLSPLTMMTVLLFGAKTWLVTPSMLDDFETFNRQNARHITVRAPVYLRMEGQWCYSLLVMPWQKRDYFL
jgi:hypothetical protein